MLAIRHRSCRVESPTISDDFLVRRTRFRTGGNQKSAAQRRPAQKLRAIFGEFGSQVGTPLRAMTEHRYPPRFHGNFFVPFCAVEFFWSGLESEPE